MPDTRLPVAPVGIALAVPRRLWRDPRWQDVYQRGLRETLTPLAAARAATKAVKEERDGQ